MHIRGFIGELKECQGLGVDDTDGENKKQSACTWDQELPAQPYPSKARGRRWLVVAHTYTALLKFPGEGGGKASQQHSRT